MKQLKKAGALIIKRKKLMIVKPQGKPFFINPGGKYENLESAENCLSRELKEELGVQLLSCKRHRSYKISKAVHSNYPLLLELYFVVISGNPTPSGEIEKIEWLDKDSFNNKRFNLAPSFYEFIPDLIKDGFL